MSPKIYQMPQPLTGTTGVVPNFKYMVCGDNLDTITSAGYLNSLDLQSYPISSTDILQILYNFNLQTQVGSYGAFTVSLTDGIITLTAASVPGEIILPVTPGNFANWANTSGALHDLGYSPTNSSLNKVAMYNGAIAAKINYVPVFSDANGSIREQVTNDNYNMDGPLIVNGYAEATAVIIKQTPDSSAASLLSLDSLSENSNYFLADPVIGVATIPVFPSNPVTVPAGNLIVAGSDAGTLADGGSPVSGFVSTSGTSTMQTGSEIVFDHTFPQTIGGGDTVTINNQSGIIQTNTLTTAGGAMYTFTLNNSLLKADGNIQLQTQYGDNTVTNIECTLLSPCTNGSCQITLINNNTVPMNGNMKIYFFVPY
jgi:hypothetical protein